MNLSEFSKMHIKDVFSLQNASSFLVNKMQIADAEYFQNFQGTTDKCLCIFEKLRKVQMNL